MNLEEKFLVLKYTDINAALSEEERSLLLDLIARVHWYREGQGKKRENRYIVINQDESYFPAVLKLMDEVEKKAGEG